MKSNLNISVEKNSVIKTCRGREEFKNELRVYSLGLDFTPKLLSYNENSFELTMSYIEGASLWEVPGVEFVILGKLFSKFHNSINQGEYVLSHKDTNPCNYLYNMKLDRYYFIDFAESGFCYPENDLISFLLFWAANCEPSEFNKIMTVFLSGYRGNAKCLDIERKKHFIEWFNDFDERRRAFNKTPCKNETWQQQNREKIMSDFYVLLA
jgi:tRNA A-37 threonylcarbamoyl transferase component Bud32